MCYMKSWTCVKCNTKDNIILLREDGNTGLTCVRFGVPVDTRNTYKGTDMGSFYSGVRSNLSDGDKPAKMIMSSFMRSETRELCKALESPNLSWRPTVLAGVAVLSFNLAFLPFIFISAAFLGVVAFLVLFGVVISVLVFATSSALTISICLPCLVESILVVVPVDFATCAILT